MFYNNIVVTHDANPAGDTPANIMAVLPIGEVFVIRDDTNQVFHSG
jgi:hypothetical protein